MPRLLAASASTLPSTAASAPPSRLSCANAPPAAATPRSCSRHTAHSWLRTSFPARTSRLLRGERGASRCVRCGTRESGAMSTRRCARHPALLLLQSARAQARVERARNERMMMQLAARRARRAVAAAAVRARRRRQHQLRRRARRRTSCHAQARARQRRLRQLRCLRCLRRALLVE